MRYSKSRKPEQKALSRATHAQAVRTAINARARHGLRLSPLCVVLLVVYNRKARCAGGRAPRARCCANPPQRNTPSRERVCSKRLCVTLHGGDEPRPGARCAALAQGERHSRVEVHPACDEVDVHDDAGRLHAPDESVDVCVQILH